MFSQQSARGSRRICQMAYRQYQWSSFVGQRRTYADAAQGSQKRGGRGIGLVFYGVAFGGMGAAITWYAMMGKKLSAYSDEETNSLFSPTDEETQRIMETIDNHPLLKELRSRPELKESRPHLKMSEEYRQLSLTSGTLLGARKMVVPPIVFIEDGGKSIVSVTYLGDQLCGYPGMIHGGFLATMLDEGLARSCFDALPNKLAVTASLEVNYRKPAPANSFYVLRGRTIKVEGRKAWVDGHIETLPKTGEKPIVLVEAKGLFISPKYAAMLPRLS